MGLGMVFTATDLASGVIQHVRNGFAQTRNEMGQFGARSKTAFKEFAMGVGVMTAGLSGLAILNSTTQHARDFQKAIALVATETDEATFSTEDMRKVSLDMAQTFGKMPVDEAQALYKGVALGADTASKATFLMNAANKLAIAGNSDLSTTMDALGGVLNSYSMDMSKASEVSDAFITAMANGNTTVQDLASVVGRLAKPAHDSGISLQEMLGSIAVMTNKGLKASEAVSGLHEAFANIIHPSHDAAMEAQRLGIKFNDAAMRSMGLRKFLHSITDNAKFTKDSLNKLFTSVEGSAAMKMLAGDMSATDAIFDKMAHSSGATETAFLKMANTGQFTKDKFEAAKETMKIFIGEIVGPMAAKASAMAAKLVSAFNSIPKPIKEMIIKGAMLASTLLTVGGALRSVLSSVSIVGSAISAFGGGTLAGLLSAFLPVVAIIGLAVGLFYTFKEAIAMNLGGVGDLFGGMVKGVKQAWESLKQLFTTGGLSGALAKEAVDGTNPWVNFAIQVYLIVNRIKNFFSEFVAGFKSEIAGFDFGPLVDAFHNLAAELGFFMNDTEKSGSAFKAWGSAGASTGQKVAQIFEAVVNAITAVVNIIGVFVSAWHEISPAIGEVTDAIGGILSDIGDLIGSLSGAGGSAESTGATFQSVGHAIGVVFSRMAHMVASSIQSVRAIFQDQLEAIKGVVNVFSGVIHGNWSQVWFGLRQIVYSAISSMIDFVFMGVQAIADAIDSVMGSHLGESVHKAQDTIREGIKGIMGLNELKQNGGENDMTGSQTVAPQFGPGGLGPPVQNTEPTSMSAPFLAAGPLAPLPQSSMDPNALGQATGQSVASALRSAPLQANVTVNVQKEGPDMGLPQSIAE